MRPGAGFNFKPAIYFRQRKNEGGATIERLDRMGSCRAHLHIYILLNYYRSPDTRNVFQYPKQSALLSQKKYGRCCKTSFFILWVSFSLCFKVSKKGVSVKVAIMPCFERLVLHDGEVCAPLVFSARFPHLGAFFFLRFILAFRV